MDPLKQTRFARSASTLAMVIPVVGLAGLALARFDSEGHVTFPPRWPLVASVGLLSALIAFFAHLAQPAADVLASIPGIRDSTLSATLTTSPYFPNPLPADWSTPFMPHRLLAWKFITPDFDVLLWCREEPDGPRVMVAVGRDGSAERAGDRRAAAILDQFQNVTSFWEVAEVPEVLLAKYPGMRAWQALPTFLVKVLENLQKRTPAHRAPPLDARLITVRKHLPARLPPGWSAPVAHAPAEPSEPKAWMFHVDEQLVMTGLVTAEQEDKLAVTIFAATGGILHSVHCADVLQHFRGVGEFVECDAGGVPNAKLFLGRIVDRRVEAALN